MRSRWSEEDAAGFVARYAGRWGEALALRTYSSRLLGSEPSLVLHGGGNSSVKGAWENVLGELAEALFVKASGVDMATIEPEGHPGLDLSYLLKLRWLPELDDQSMVNELRTHLLRADSPTPSIEALVHAFIPRTYVDHTHADAILALTNRQGGAAAVRQALGDEVVVLDYVTPGFKLAQTVAAALEEQPHCKAMVWAHHGIVTWGDSARESYEQMIDLVSRAEAYLARLTEPSEPPSEANLVRVAATVGGAIGVEVAQARAAAIAPIVRGMLAEPGGGPDRNYRRMVVTPLVTREVLDLLARPGAKELALTAPLTTDHLIRTKALPAWIDDPAHDQPDVLRGQIHDCIAAYKADYEAYLDRHAAQMPAGLQPFDSLPRVILVPGVGALCAGRDLREATHRKGHKRSHLGREGSRGEHRVVCRPPRGRAFPHGIQDSATREAGGRPAAAAERPRGYRDRRSGGDRRGDSPWAAGARLRRSGHGPARARRLKA